MVDKSSDRIEPTEVGRREVLRKSLLWGGVGAAAAVLGVPAKAAAANGSSGSAFACDVACLGQTFRLTPAPGVTPDDLRGTSFSVEGLLYPANTIPAGLGFNPSSVEAVGTWFCRGWFTMHGGRPEPMVLTTQEYILGAITADQLYPEDQIVSSGLEGSGDPAQPAVRSVIGGTGAFNGASGTVLQHGIGSNVTHLIEPTGLVFGPAPNFRFEFQFKS